MYTQGRMSSGMELPDFPVPTELGGAKRSTAGGTPGACSSFAGPTKSGMLYLVGLGAGAEGYNRLSWYFTGKHGVRGLAFPSPGLCVFVLSFLAVGRSCPCVLDLLSPVFGVGSGVRPECRCAGTNGRAIG